MKNITIKAASIALLSLSLAFAAKKEFIRDYTYQASEMDSKVTARANASAEMRNILLREIGEFIKVSQTLINEEFSRDIETVSAGIVEMIIISENWTGSLYHIKAKMTVDEADVIRKIDAIVKDRQRSDELRDFRIRATEAEAELRRLRALPDKSQYEKQALLVESGNNFMSGVAAYENGNYSAALKFFKNVEKNADAYYMLGKVYAGIGNTKKSDANFKKAADMGHPAAQFRIRKQGYKR